MRIRKFGEEKALNMLQNITIDTLINHLGQPNKKMGNEYIWQCPYCRDTHKDNLKFNTQKGLLKCFADDSHARQILSTINKQSGINYPKTNKNVINEPSGMPAELSSKQLEENLTYMSQCNNELLNNEKALNHILHKRGINKNTVDFCGIGIDKDLHKWVIPIFKYDKSEVIGFEYRPPLLPNAIKEKRTEAEQEAKKGISRKKGSLSGMAEINSKTGKTEVLAIVEGFLDGYTLFQYLLEQNQAEFYHVITPSNGISSLLKQIEVINFNNYKHIYLYIDTDEKSKPIADKILKKYSFIEFVSLQCCKDFNEHYLKCLKKGV